MIKNKFIRGALLMVLITISQVTSLYAVEYPCESFEALANAIPEEKSILLEYKATVKRGAVLMNTHTNDSVFFELTPRVQNRLTQYLKALNEENKWSSQNYNKLTLLLNRLDNDLSNHCGG